MFRKTRRPVFFRCFPGFQFCTLARAGRGAVSVFHPFSGRRDFTLCRSELPPGFGTDSVQTARRVLHFSPSGFMCSHCILTVNGSDRFVLRRESWPPYLRHPPVCARGAPRARSARLPCLLLCRV